MTAPTHESTDPILRLLTERIGLDPASVGENLIRSGVRSRMKQLGLNRQVDYERLLVGPTDEIQALIEEVVIPESWFFRDERPFAALRDLARKGWVDQPSRPPLTVLCLPCAGGEEPYSVVMTLLDQGLPRDRFEVVAVDISERSVLRAARGIYGVNSFRGVPTAVRERYFDTTEMPGRYLLRATVRSAVRFERGNILDPRLLSDHARFAIVFCRNLLIYFDDAARATAARHLNQLIAPDGYLFLGHADRVDVALSEQFVPFGGPGNFLYRRRDGNVPLATPAVTPGLRPAGPVPSGGSSARASRATPVVPSRVAPGPKPAPPPPSSSPPPPPAVAAGESGPAETLAEATLLADRGQYGEAIGLIRRHLGRGPRDAPAHALLGMVYQAAGDRAQAEAELLKAVYLDPEHDESLLALALLARRRGDVAAEALFRRRAERVRTRKERS